MGYKITMNQGVPEMSFDADETIATDLLLSALVPLGGFFLDSAFGLRELPKSITEQNSGLVKDYFEESAKWLVDSGKAKSVSALVEKDLQEPSRLNVKETALQANEEPVTFETFVPVV